MRKLILTSFILLAAGVFMLPSPLTDRVTAAQSQKLLRHIVLYKFKDEIKPEQVQEVIDAFVALPKQIDTIIGFEHGPNVSTEGKSDGLTYGFVVTFKTKADLDAYIKHPAHQAYVNIVKDRREKVVVFDYWTEE